MTQYAIGIDYGTNSVRGTISDIQDGRELAASVFPYPSGKNGIILDPADPNIARQNPQDYLDGLEAVITGALQQASAHEGFTPEQIVGIGIDTTGSTPIPIGADGQPLAFSPEFSQNPNALSWLWKDHSGFSEAGEITRLAAQIRPQYLRKCGGIYSSEWYWSKILHCLRADPGVFDAAATWAEHADWIPAVLTATTLPRLLQRGICAAAHKAFFHPEWGGYPDEDFLAQLDPKLPQARALLPYHAYPAGASAGGLCPEWAARTGLPEGIAVSIGAFDAHLGAVGSGIGPKTLVKNIGTSTCDMMVAPMDTPIADIPGLCGIAPESILPGFYGLEAGQSAVGDIFNWFVEEIKPDHLGHEELTRRASNLKPGQSGLLALDWHNGNRTILVDQRLTGAVLGLTLHTRPEELYRAWIEATAYGARVIMERFEEYGQPVEQIVNCGGISVKNPLVMQIYADVMGRPIAVSRSAQTAALGAAIAGAVAGGAFPDFASAMERMTGLQDQVFVPEPRRQATYNGLFALYRRVHDAFGVPGTTDDLSDIMKELLRLRDQSLETEEHQ